MNESLAEVSMRMAGEGFNTLLPENTSKFEHKGRYDTMHRQAHPISDKMGKLARFT